MVYLKTIQKITPKDVAVSGTIDGETYLKKFKGVFSPLSALPGSVYGLDRTKPASLYIGQGDRCVAIRKNDKMNLCLGLGCRTPNARNQTISARQSLLAERYMMTFVYLFEAQTTDF